jgi:hypothetical protein
LKHNELLLWCLLLFLQVNIDNIIMILNVHCKEITLKIKYKKYIIINEIKKN